MTTNVRGPAGLRARFSRRRQVFLGATALVAAATLSGCTPDAAPAATTPAPTTTASPTPTPTSTILPVPASEDEATAGAEAALQKFIELENQIFAERGANPERIDFMATSPASDAVRSSAEQIASAGYIITGGIVATVHSSSAVDAQTDPVVPFGSATISFCNDASQRTVSLPDGSAAPQPVELASVLEASVLFVPPAGRWIVRSFVTTEETC